MSSIQSRPLANVVSAGIIADDEDDLVVLRAQGRRNRMAKTISISQNGQHVVGHHDGRKVYHVAHARTVKVGNLLEAARALARVAGDEFIIRGALLDGLPPQFRRLLRPKINAPATLVEVPRSYVLLDIDRVPGILPWYDPAKSDNEDATSAVEELIKDLLPRPFHNVSCWFGFTASHGIKSGMNLRLFFRLGRSMTADDLKAWLGYLRQRGVDSSVFGPAQQVLVAPPILQRGVTDPVRVRWGFVQGFRHKVDPPTPSALHASAAIRRSGPRHKSPRSPLSAGSLKKSSGSGSSNGRGYRNRLSRIGDGPDQDGIHGAILAAVGAWVRENGPDADPATLIGDITEQVSTTAICPATHPATYLGEQLVALPQLVADVCEMERDRQTSEAVAQQARMRTAVASQRSLVTTTVDIAAQAVQAAVKDFVDKIPTLRETRDVAWQLSHESDFGKTYGDWGIKRRWRIRGLAAVDVGIGKTNAVITEVVALLNREPNVRVVYVVPAHKLADDVLNRFNQVAGREVAAVWRGIAQPDPSYSTATMCRRPEDADLVMKGGGELASLCGSTARGLCQFHPDSGGPCAYIRQKQLKPSVWIVPAAMLTSAVPNAMKRNSLSYKVGQNTHEATPPAFDLLVLDEAPFLNWLGGFGEDQVLVAKSWLDPAVYRSRNGSNPQTADAVIEKAFASLQDMATAVCIGTDARDEFYSGECRKDHTDDTPEFSKAGALLWDVLGKGKVDPSLTGPELAASLNSRLEPMARIRAVQRLLKIHADILDGKAGVSCVGRDTMPDGSPAIRLRWREDIDTTWLDCPVLYLDATAQLQVAERWLGKIKLLVTAKAATPNMRIVQVDDRAFGYSTLINRSHPATSPAINAAGTATPLASSSAGAVPSSPAVGHQRRISSLLETVLAGTSGTGLFVGPKKLAEQMCADGAFPRGWQTATFGSLRGVDRFNKVSAAVVASRQLPAPADVELMAEVVFGRNVKRIEADWYPAIETIRLMADGTGREAETECHPDPDVEAVRWTICEAEVLQAIGRVRGVWRTAAKPVLVFVLNNLDLGDLPVSELMTWDELSAKCGPTMLMAARGCVPKMWADVAHMIGRWNSADPAANARAWFRDNPAEKERRESVFRTGQIIHPFTGKTIHFHRQSLGRVGKNHRYVWLANGMTVADARAILP